jgi:hypothetical protein
MCIALAFSLQSTETIYEITGSLRNAKLKKSGYVATFKLEGNRTKFVLRVPKEKAEIYLPNIRNGEEARICYLKPYFGQAWVVEFASRDLTIGKDELIKAYKEDRLAHIIIVAFSLSCLIISAVLLCKNAYRSFQKSAKKAA